MTGQIFWGTLVLGICSTIHLFMIIAWVDILRNRTEQFKILTPIIRLYLQIGGTFILIVLSHTIQVWVWAGALLSIDALNSLRDAIYFSIVTYTTVGYGDVTLPDGHRIFGAMASVTGLLNFGVSTAFLVSVIGKILPEHFKDEDDLSR